MQLLRCHRLRQRKRCSHTLREKRREQGQDEVRLMFIDVKKAHYNANCYEEELVELLNEFKEFGNHAKLKRWLYGARKAAGGRMSLEADW